MKGLIVVALYNLAELHLLDAFRHDGREAKVLAFAAEAPGIQLSHELRLVFLGDVVDDEAPGDGRRVGFDPDLPIGAVALEGELVALHAVNRAKPDILGGDEFSPSALPTFE